MTVLMNWRWSFIVAALYVVTGCTSGTQTTSGTALSGLMGTSSTSSLGGNGQGPSAGSSSQNQVPPAASNLSAVVESSTSVQLSWTDNSSGTASFYIQREVTEGTGSFATVGQVSPGTTSYLDSNLTNNWQYNYQVIAFNSYGSANPSSSLTIQVIYSGSGSGSPSPTPTPTPSSTPSPTPSSSAPPAPTPTPVSTSSGASSSVPLDCANSSQQALCNYVEANMQMKSAPVTLSTACQNPSNPVAVNPSNFASVLNSLQSGQTAVFAAGTYNLTQTFNLVTGANYCGQASNPGAVVLNSNGDSFILDGVGGGNTIEGITFNGGGILVGDGSWANNVFIQHNVIENVSKPDGSQNTDQGNAIVLGWGNNVTISQNYIYNNLGGIMQWNVAGNILITDNKFSHTLSDDIGYEGTSTSATGANMRIARNGFVDSRRITIEMFVPALSSLLIEDNAIVYEATFIYFTEPFAEGTYGMGISLPYAPNNTIIRNNWMFGPANSWNGADPQAAIETYGPMQIYDNVMQYWGQGLLEAAGGPSMSVTNNSMCNIVTAQAADGGYTGNAGTFTNNGCVENAQGYGEP